MNSTKNSSILAVSQQQLKVKNFTSLIIINVSVPYVCVLTTSYDQTLTPVGVNGGTLPCVRLACATSGDCVTKEPHLSSQHCELNAKQHVLDRTRVSVSRQYSTSLGEVAAQT